MKERADRDLSFKGIQRRQRTCAPAGVQQAGHRGGVQCAVALYVLATGITDPDKLCADLKLRSRITAESALSFWAGAGLLERYDENAAPSLEPSAPAPMTWQEIAAASRTDPMISSLIDCGQTSFGRALTHKEMEKLVNLYILDGYAPETVMLCLAYTGQLRQTHAGGGGP